MNYTMPFRFRSLLQVAAPVLALSSAFACGESASLQDRSCPCADDNVCCAGANRCVAKGTSCDAVYGNGLEDSGGAKDAGDPGDAGDSGNLDPVVPPGKRLRVFISSTVHQGNFGGIAGADAICASAAQRANLSGEWIAFVSDSTTRSIDRVRGEGPWYLVDRKTLLFPNHGALAINPRSQIDQDETGAKYSPAYVWTGTNPYHPPTNCSDWTSTSGTGTWVFAGYPYSNIVSVPCTELSSLICIEQPH